MSATLADAVLPILQKVHSCVPILITLIALISLYNRQKVHSSVYVPILIALIALISLGLGLLGLGFLSR